VEARELMGYEREQDFTPMNTVEEIETMMKEWGGLIRIVDPAIVKSGDMSRQREALNHNNHVWPLFVELAKNELVDMEAEYNRQFIVELDKLDGEACRAKNITAAQKKSYVEKVLGRSIVTADEKVVDGIGVQIKKFKNKITKLEEVAKAQMNLLWTYNKGGGGYGS